MKRSDKAEGSGSTRKLQSRVPDAARVPKPAARPDLLGEGDRLRVTPRARAKANAKLRDIAERIRRGDDTGLESLLPPLFGRSRRGLGECNHYLPANRFEWWDVDRRGLIPATQPIGVIGSEGTSADEIFYSEFCSPLSTVIGEDLHLVKAGNTVPWEFHPRFLGDLEVRYVPDPGSVPQFKQIEVILGPQRRASRKVLVNCVQEGYELDPQQTRPSLFFDFYVPQRAVGLECGFLGENGREINPASVKLIARDRVGEVLVESKGNDLFRVPWQANAVYNYIGVRHSGGDIRSVELRFEDPEEVILEPQIVYRIWHEPLPPAAVTQGTAAVEWDPDPDADGTGIAVPPHDGPLGPVTLDLPFNCDRAVVMMRGFKMFFLDQQPHEVEFIDAYIGPEPYIAPRGVFETEPGGQITLVPRGHLRSDGTEACRVLIYYLVLAWDSQFLELEAVPEEHIEELHNSGYSQGATIRNAGGFRALQGFGFYARNGPQEIEHVSLAMGGPSIGPPRIAVGPYYIGESGPQLDSWPFAATSFDDVSRSWRKVQGIVLAARSGLTSDVARRELEDFPTRFGPRDRSEPFFFVADGPELAAYVPAVFLPSDMAFLSLGMFIFEPKGKIRELEIEVRGTHYDGRFIQWQVGGGISVSPPVTGTGGGQRRYLVGWPVFGWIVRERFPLFPSELFPLRTQDLRFDDGVRGILSLEPDRYGAIRNDAKVPLFLTRAERAGPQVDEFNFLVDYRGETFVPENELADRAPLMLYPGETLLMGGRFYPQEDTDPNGPSRLAWVHFFNGDYRVATVYAEGRTVPENPYGSMLPEAIHFGPVNISLSDNPLNFPTRALVLTSDGTTPLLIESLAFDDPSLGFSFTIREAGGGILYQIESGSSMVLDIRFVPNRPGEVETHLVALTNFGRLEARVLGIGEGNFE